MALLRPHAHRTPQRRFRYGHRYDQPTQGGQEGPKHGGLQGVIFL